MLSSVRRYASSATASTVSNHWLMQSELMGTSAESSARKQVDPTATGRKCSSACWVAGNARDPRTTPGFYNRDVKIRAMQAIDVQ